MLEWVVRHEKGRVNVRMRICCGYKGCRYEYHKGKSAN